MSTLQRFWFRFEKPHIMGFLNLGCGVTAYNYDDAVELLRTQVFEGLFKVSKLPAIESVIEIVDASMLERNHVLPNIGSMDRRGVWFPNMELD